MEIYQSESVPSLISVIIPTHNRPELVIRAVKSVLSQTYSSIEVIIIIDGPDEKTISVLNKIRDPRLKVVISTSRVGAGCTRNIGVRESQGQWVSFLDDDDEWFPRKLDIQFKTVKHSSSLYPIISCRFIARSEQGYIIWPLRYPKNDEPLSEYLFSQSGLFGGEGFVAMPSILTKKELLQKIPFSEDLKAHYDWDWLLRVSKLKGVNLEFVPQRDPLVICHMEENRDRISNQTNWRYSISWAKKNIDLFTPRAYISFLLTKVSLHAVRMKERNAFKILLQEACKYGKPRLIDLIAYALIWFIPRNIRRKITILLGRIFPKNGKIGVDR